jgi:hypothetical protein
LRGLTVTASDSVISSIDRDELADADAGIVHECENCVVAFLEIVGTTAIHRGPEGVELVDLETDARLNFGIRTVTHERDVCLKMDTQLMC